MTQLETLIPRSGLLTWHEADSIVGVADGGNVTNVPDKSGNGHDLVCSSNHPTFETDWINGLPVVNFNGTRDPLVYTGSLGVKHIFVIAAYADATFPTSGGAGEYAGLLSGIDTANNAILVGDPTTTKFFNVGYGAGHQYRRRDVIYAESNMQAAMSGAISIFEVSLASGWPLDGIQIGKDRTFANRKWKGPFVGDLMWNRVLADTERFDVYEYIATKYWLWKRVSSGLDVWPFQPNWTRPLTVDKRVLSSTSVSGANKSRSKGTAKIGIEPQFDLRGPEEYDAAVAFWNDKYPGTSFIYRDDAFSPARETEMRFVSGIQQQAASTREISYSFQAVQV